MKEFIIERLRWLATFILFLSLFIGLIELLKLCGLFKLLMWIGI